MYVRLTSESACLASVLEWTICLALTARILAAQTLRACNRGAGIEARSRLPTFSSCFSASLRFCRLLFPSFIFFLRDGGAYSFPGRRVPTLSFARNTWHHTGESNLLT
ncbi:hypothetical protein B0H14DRAFT_663342 [Mycena olivaceomarginata]|nr:hypothetical protein B0H14DRAFT_663342 [Mycena olivaceomarginata]